MIRARCDRVGGLRFLRVYVAGRTWCVSWCETRKHAVLVA